MKNIREFLKIILISCILVLAVFFSLYLLLDCSMMWKGNPKKVELYKKDYTVMVDLAFQLLEKSGKESLTIGVEYSLSSNDHQIDMPFLVAYEMSHIVKKLTITDEQTQSLINICENSFGDTGHSLSRIEADKNQIEFWTASNWYALIYTKNGEKPVIALRDRYNAYFKKVNANWYQMRLKYQY